MPVDSRDSNKRGQGGADLGARELRGRGPEGQKELEHFSQNGWKEALVGRGQEIKMQKQKRPFKKPKNTG